MQPIRSRSAAPALTLSLLAGLLAACTTAGEPTPVPGSPPKVIGDSVSGRCDDKAAAAYVGRSISDDVAEQARGAAGASGVRIIRPGMAVTMDYRAGRLNLEVDDAGRVIKATCG